MHLPQPIETAPHYKDVLVWRRDSGWFIARFVTPDAVITPEEMERENLEFPDDFQEWFSDAWGWHEGSEKPTHWLPLPPDVDLPAETVEPCPTCIGGLWVCENHPDQIAHECPHCKGAGMPCACSPMYRKPDPTPEE